jgi:hypothetical protein
MDAPAKALPQRVVRVTKATTWLGCLFLLLGIPFLPNYYSSLGMPWPIFFATLGMMSLCAFISFGGFLWCRERGERISNFYAICPLLLLTVLPCFSYRHDIIPAILRLQGAWVRQPGP